DLLEMGDSIRVIGTVEVVSSSLGSETRHDLSKSGKSRKQLQQLLDDMKGRVEGKSALRAGDSLRTTPVRRPLPLTLLPMGGGLLHPPRALNPTSRVAEEVLSHGGSSGIVFPLPKPYPQAHLRPNRL